MKYVSLPKSGKKTSQLGFGCAFVSSVREVDAARLLDAAYDHGIRHFDVAPFYSDGAAEGYLGKFLSRHDDISVATKYGLLPISDEALQARLMRIFLKPAYKSMRAGMKWPFQAKISAISRRKAKFTVAEMEWSLNRSLTLLKRNHIDVFLLHEPDAHDLKDERLMNSIRQSIADSRIGAIGIGTPFHQAGEVLQTHRSSFWDVIQHDWNAFSGSPSFPNTFQILFWVATQNFKNLHRSFLHNDQLVRHWSDKVDLDLCRPDNLRMLLLKSALLANDNGIVLICSSNVDHIHQNVAVAENSSLDRSARILLELAQAASPSELASFCRETPSFVLGRVISPIESRRTDV
jgi:D-threo-aldose 1-dehydrogenase